MRTSISRSTGTSLYHRIASRITCAQPPILVPTSSTARSSMSPYTSSTTAMSNGLINFSCVLPFLFLFSSSPPFTFTTYPSPLLSSTAVGGVSALEACPASTCSRRPRNSSAPIPCSSSSVVSSPGSNPDTPSPPCPPSRGLHFMSIPPLSAVSLACLSRSSNSRANACIQSTTASSNSSMHHHGDRGQRKRMMLRSLLTSSTLT